MHKIHLKIALKQLSQARSDIKYNKKQDQLKLVKFQCNHTHLLVSRSFMCKSQFFIFFSRHSKWPTATTKHKISFSNCVETILCCKFCYEMKMRATLSHSIFFFLVRFVHCIAYRFKKILFLPVFFLLTFIKWHTLNMRSILVTIPVPLKTTCAI